MEWRSSTNQPFHFSFFNQYYKSKFVLNGIAETKRKQWKEKQTSRCPIKFILFINPFFENGWVDWKRIEFEGLCGQMESINLLWNESWLVTKPPGAIELHFSSPALPCGGLWALQRQWLRQRELTGRERREAIQKIVKSNISSWAAVDEWAEGEWNNKAERNGLIERPTIAPQIKFKK